MINFVNISGIIMSAFVINQSFSAWKKNPVVTSVAQLPIEAVPFPAITICPIGNTRYAYDIASTMYPTVQY